MVNHNGNVATAQGRIAFSCHLHRSAKYLCDKLYKRTGTRNVALLPSLIIIISMECHSRDITSCAQRDGSVLNIYVLRFGRSTTVETRRSLMTSLNKSMRGSDVLFEVTLRSRVIDIYIDRYLDFK